MKQKKFKSPLENQLTKQKIDIDIAKKIDNLINKKMQKALLNMNKFTHNAMRNIERDMIKNMRLSPDHDDFSKGFKFSSQQLMQSFALHIKKILIKTI